MDFQNKMNEEFNKLIVEETYPFITVFKTSKNEENQLFKLQINKRSPMYVFDEFVIEDTVMYSDLDKTLKESDRVPAMSLSSISLARAEMTKEEILKNNEAISK